MDYSVHCIFFTGNSTSILSSDGSVNETTDSSTAKNEEMEDFSLSSMASLLPAHGSRQNVSRTSAHLLS